MNKLYFVVPYCNKTEVLSETTRRLLEKMGRKKKARIISADYNVLHADNGSRDGAWGLIEKLHNADQQVSDIQLHGNGEPQNALHTCVTTAQACCDMTVSMNTDVQDDIEALEAFVQRSDKGCGIACGVHSNRWNSSRFKMGPAESFCRLMAKLGAERVFTPIMAGIGSTLSAAFFAVFVRSVMDLSAEDDANASTWMLLSVWPACGLGLTAAGIVGFYAGRVDIDTKQRLWRFVETVLDEMTRRPGQHVERKHA